MNDIEAILAELRKFNQERDWDQFHNGKDLAIGLSVEASELLECFLWKKPEDVPIDKIQRNAKKYPVEKAKGSAKKYDEL